ncbi:MAG: hypothetical protein QMD08_08190 [Actinomycetota bacterium]|nr:hypothetical protein [Actinomycetota bacterium]
MDKVDVLVWAPGCCYICKCTPEGPYVDTRKDSSWGDEHIYICKDCILEMARLLGFEEPKKVAHAYRCFGALTQQNKRLKEKLAAFEEIEKKWEEIKCLSSA